MSTHLRTRGKTWTAVAAGAAALAFTLGPAPSHAAAQQPPAGGQGAASDPALLEHLTGNGRLNRGMNELAVGEYRRFLEAHPNHEKAGVARYGLGVAPFRMKKYEEAATELRPLLEKNDFEFAAETLLTVG